MTYKAADFCARVPHTEATRTAARWRESHSHVGSGGIMKKIGILTSGGDCSGMNAAIRSAVRSGLRNNVEMLGFRKGYVGLMKPDYITLDSKAVSGILHRGGTFLQSARSPEFRTIEGQQQALANLKNLGVEGLIILGGDGSLTGALALHNLGFPVIGIPASIDNDIPYTDMALGVDTALNNIIYAVDCIKDTASSHARASSSKSWGAIRATWPASAPLPPVPNTPGSGTGFRPLRDMPAVTRPLRRRTG